MSKEMQEEQYDDTSNNNNNNNNDCRMRTAVFLMAYCPVLVILVIGRKYTN
jgi:hypothetical protein